MGAKQVLKPGKVAVITGAASGIGLAAAKAFAKLGMKVCMADLNTDELHHVMPSVAKLCENGMEDVLVQTVDVSVFSHVEELRDAVYARFGRVDVLMNNAGVLMRAGSWNSYNLWQQMIGVNLWGVINGVQAFTDAMLSQNSPGLIINTGSKQGITSPPGNTAYNVSKAGVKALTEGLAHSLRNYEGAKISAHLLIPGFVYSGMIKKHVDEKPPSAWTPEQTVEFMIERLNAGDFYILCPDNEVDRVVDEKRIAWAAADIIENRPALSRWHPAYSDAFRDFMAEAEEADA